MSDDVRLSANVIRPSTPRQVTVTYPQSPEQAAAITQTRADIADMEAELALYRRNFPSDIHGLDQLQKRIDNARAKLIGNSTVTVSGMDLTINPANGGKIADNVLNDYIDVQYHIIFSMLSQDAALHFQTSGYKSPDLIYDINTMKAQKRPDGAEIIASTGDVFGDQASDKQYYAVESLVYKNICEPTPSNPLIASMLNMKMKIVEPHGFKFYENLRDMGDSQGYADVNLGRFLYRVDIYFSGYAPSGEWQEQISLNGDGVKVISSVVSITNLEAEVTSTGTVYTLDLVPAGHQAHRSEDVILEANTFNSGANFRDFLSNLSAALSAAKSARTDDQIIRHYEFYAPQELLDSPFDVTAFVNDNQRLMTSESPEHIISTGKDVDIITMLQGALSNTLIAQEMALSDHDNAAFTKPSVLFQVEFNTVYGDPAGGVNKDAALHDYKEITHQYVIVPFVTFKHGPVNQDSIEDYVSPGNQSRRIEEMIRMGMVRRVYDYMYTGENTEVIDFDVRLKTFFYNTLTVNPSTGGSVGRQNFNMSSGTARQFLDQAGSATDLFRVNTTGLSDVSDVMKRLFGSKAVSGSRVSGNTSGRSGASRLGGGFNESPTNGFFGDTSTSPASRRQEYENFMTDYLNLDLLSLEGLRIKGDPIWLLSPYTNVDLTSYENGGSSRGISTLGSGGVVPIKTRTGQVIFLKIFPPNQNDFMNPNRTSGSSYETIIGGFYQVLSVTSSFEGGKFYQSVDGIKINNLNYADASSLVGSI